MALYTSRALAEGDEVCLDYGARPNSEWLLHYGFLPPSNKNDVQSLGGPYSIGWSDLPLENDDCIAEALEALEAVQGDVGLLEDPRRDVINAYRSQRRRLLREACGASCVLILSYLLGWRQLVEVRRLALHDLDLRRPS